MRWSLDSSLRHVFKLSESSVYARSSDGSFLFGFVITLVADVASGSRLDLDIDSLELPISTSFTNSLSSGSGVGNVLAGASFHVSNSP